MHIKDSFSKATSEIVDKERDGAAWTVCADYGHERRDSAYWIFATAPVRRHYRPLADRPGLFHEFAMVGRERFKEGPDETFGATTAAIEWARKHGVLGLSPPPRPYRKPAGGMALSKVGDPGDVILGFGQGDHYRDSVPAFVREAWTAGMAWKFYEAALKGDEDEVSKLDHQFAAHVFGDEYGGTMFEDGLPRGLSPKDEVHAWGMNAAAEITQGRVSAWCSPTFYHRDGRLRRGWGFRNLAGAMWLQFYWLLTADEDGGHRCENPDCPDKNPVLYREPGKRGKHPRYCPNPDGGQSRCRMRANYLNNTKPKRRKARTSN
jgi:hypothetical protein